jgi:four helix bundle protein
MGTKRKDEELADRLLDFAVRIIKLVKRLPNNKIGIHVSGQLLRSGTSPGANYEEARGAESKADFIHKLGIVLKELKESRFWIKVIIRVPLLQPDKVAPLLDECEALIAIIAKSIFTARKSKKDQ